MTSLYRSETPVASEHTKGSEIASESIEWLAPGQQRVVRVAGVQITMRLVGRKGRRARISISAPAGAVFSSVEPREAQEPTHQTGQQGAQLR